MVKTLYEKFVIVRREGGPPLNTFFPNDIPEVFGFSRRSYMSFGTRGQAQAKISHIRKEVGDPRNQSRWGERLSKRYARLAKSLKVDVYMDEV